MERLSRLRFFSSLGLANESRSGVYFLAAELEDNLRKLGLEGDIIEAMHRRLKERAPESLKVYDPEQQWECLTGEVLDIGLENELYDRHFFILRTFDNQAHYVRFPKLLDGVESFKPSAVVSVESGVGALMGKGMKIPARWPL